MIFASREALGLPPALQSLVDEAESAIAEGRHEAARTAYEGALHGLTSATQAHAAAALLMRIGCVFLEENDGAAADDCFMPRARSPRPTAMTPARLAS